MQETNPDEERVRGWAKYAKNVNVYEKQHSSLWESFGGRYTLDTLHPHLPHCLVHSRDLRGDKC